MTKQRRRYYRTVILGIVAMATLIWAAMDQFGISRDVMLSLFYSVLAGMAGIILLGGICAGIWVALRKLSGRR